jgi:hypothetical protein
MEQDRVPRCSQDGWSLLGASVASRPRQFFVYLHLAVDMCVSTQRARSPRVERRGPRRAGQKVGILASAAAKRQQQGL